MAAMCPMLRNHYRCVEELERVLTTITGGMGHVTDNRFEIGVGFGLRAALLVLSEIGTGELAPDRVGESLLRHLCDLQDGLNRAPK